jgi:hypothetical protein
MQPRPVGARSPARAAGSMSALWNEGLCGRRHDRLQLMRRSLGGLVALAPRTRVTPQPYAPRCSVLFMPEQRVIILVLRTSQIASSGLCPMESP